MVGRSRIKGHYVTRDSRGRFKRWLRIGRSIRADRRKQVGSDRIPKNSAGGLMPGYGDLGDYPKRKRKKDENMFRM